MKKIIHLSDTHIGYEGIAPVMDRLVTSIISRFQEHAQDYIIVITGDVVQDGTKPGSYEEALRYLDRLRSAGFTLFCAPGNHDYGPGGWGSQSQVAKFKRAFWGTEEPYPIKRVQDSIAFLCLDSMADELHWYDRLFPQGELGAAQIDALEAMLHSDPEVVQADYRVVFLHHNPFKCSPFSRLKDTRRLGRVLKRYKIDALLFGHKHHGGKWRKWHIPRCYDGGSATGKKGAPSPHRVIDLSLPPDTDWEGSLFEEHTTT